MTPVKPNPKYPDENPQRTNVSERAIGRTLHQLDLYKLIKEGILTKQSAIAAVDKLNRQQVQEILKGEGFAVYDSEPLSKLRTALKAHIKDDPDFNWSIVLEMAG